jgi:hypothetical protein
MHEEAWSEANGEEERAGFSPARSPSPFASDQASSCMTRAHPRKESWLADDDPGHVRMIEALILVEE